MNETIRDSLQKFTTNFLEFRDSVFDIRNGFENYELSSGVQSAELEKNTKIGIEELEKEIAEFEEKLADTSLSEDDRLALEAKVRDRNERIKIAKDEVKQTKKSVEAQEIAYRDQLREAINKLNESLELPGFNHTKHNALEVLKNKILTAKLDLEIRIAEHAHNLEKAGTQGEKEAFRLAINKLQAELKELDTLLSRLADFQTMLDGFNDKYIKNHRSIDVVDLQSRMSVLDDLANYFDNNVLEDMLTVNFKLLSDGTMALDIRCGRHRVSPNPIIKPTDDIEKEVMRCLNGFAFKYSEDTGKSIRTITGEKVRVKVNGEDKAKVDFDNVPAYGKNVLLGNKLDNIEEEKLEAGELTQEEQQNTQQQPVPGEQQPAPGEQQPAPGEQQPAQEEQQPAPEEQQPAPEEQQPAPEEQQPAPEEQQPAPEEQQPAPEEQQPAPGELGTPTEQTNNNSRLLDKTDMQALKVTERRLANAKMYKKVSGILGTAAIGLGFAGTALGFGLAPAAVLGGAFLATTGFDVIGKVKENIKFAATRHKFKKIAKRVEKELDILIEPVFDTKKRNCGFILVDEEGNHLSEDYLTTDSMRQSLPQGLDDQIISIFDEEFERANRYRGLGDSASSIKEIRFREFPKITFDDPKAAFVDFGGVKSHAEINGFGFNADRYVADVQENRKDDDGVIQDVQPVDVSEDPSLGGPEPQQPTPGEPAQPAPAEPAQPAPAEPAQPAPAEPAQPAPAEPAQPAPAEPAQPAPAAPEDPDVAAGIAQEIADMLSGLDGQGASVLPTAPEGGNDSLTPTEQVVRAVDNLVANIGLDNLTFDNIQAELENQVDGRLFTAEQADAYVAELEARGLINDQEKVALNEMINGMAEKFVDESKGMGL